ARQFLRQPQEVKLLEKHEGGKIRQRFYEIEHPNRLQAVATLLKHYRPVSTLAFCNTKQQCRELVQLLNNLGFHALTLNGDMEQRE
ncbi:MAG TPA: ATP-dependent RNA helicase DbpA, partial [Rhodocyclaceae bacterium]|nr:ATP-dependent RNA helicase DbpA [Rhodocyclaceae bacterium]